MIETDLAQALGIFVEDVLKDLRLPMKNADPQPVQVFDGYLPPKKVLKDDQWPFVIVRVQKVVSEMDSTVVTIDLVVGCYSPETDGYARCLEVMQRLRTVFCQLPAQTLADRYQMRFPVEWNNVDEQPYPHWQMVMTTQWLMRTPQFVDQF